jgi:hypothetical protein
MLKTNAHNACGPSTKKGEPPVRLSGEKIWVVVGADGLEPPTYAL